MRQFSQILLLAPSWHEVLSAAREAPAALEAIAFTERFLKGQRFSVVAFRVFKERENEMISWLRKRGWIRRRRDTLLPEQRKMDQIEAVS